MRLKIEGTKLTTLTLPDQYRKWKQQVTMLCMSLRVSYLLKLAPSQSGPSVDVSIQGTPKGKEKAKEDNDEEITKERWESESEQMVAELYSHVAPIYQPMIYALTPKTLPKLFETFDAMFIVTDPMIKLSKRMELNSFKFQINNKFLDQLLKFDALAAELEELQATVSSQDLIFVLINALPLLYKEKIADLITSDPEKYNTYIAVRTGLIAKYERDKAWGLIDGKDERGGLEPSLDTALYGEQRDEQREGGRNKGTNTRGRGSGREKSHEGRRSPDLSNILCFNCYKCGHFTMKCPDPVTWEAREELEEFLAKDSEERREYLRDKKRYLEVDKLRNEKEKSGSSSGREREMSAFAIEPNHFAFFANTYSHAPELAFSPPSIPAPPCAAPQEISSDPRSPETEREPPKDGRQGILRFAGGVEIHTPPKLRPSLNPAPPVSPAPCATTKLHKQINLNNKHNHPEGALGGRETEGYSQSAGSSLFNTPLKLCSPPIASPLPIALSELSLNNTQRNPPDRNPKTVAFSMPVSEGTAAGGIRSGSAQEVLLRNNNSGSAQEVPPHEASIPGKTSPHRVATEDGSSPLSSAKAKPPDPRDAPGGASKHRKDLLDPGESHNFASSTITPANFVNKPLSHDKHMASSKQLVPFAQLQGSKV